MSCVVCGNLERDSGELDPQLTWILDTSSSFSSPLERVSDIIIMSVCVPLCIRLGVCDVHVDIVYGHTILMHISGS